MLVNRYNHVILVTIILQLPFFLGTSYNKHITINIVYLICRIIEKNLLLINRKMKKKKQISKYHALSLIKTMRKI